MTPTEKFTLQHVKLFTTWTFTDEFTYESPDVLDLEVMLSGNCNAFAELMQARCRGAGRTPEQRDVSRRKQAATRLANLAAKAEPKPDANCDETRLTAGALAPTLNPTPTPKGLQVSGFFTTNEVATAMGTTVKTMVGLLEAGILKCSITEGGHRRVHSESMDLVREAGIWADDISTTVPRSDLIGAYLRWATLPMGDRPRVLDFVYGYCMCRFGLETHMARFPR